MVSGWRMMLIKLRWHYSFFVIACFLSACTQLDDTKNEGADKITLDMVAIPSGSFLMGSKYSSDATEKPQHLVTMSNFKIMQHEVTFSQWDACVLDGGCRYRPSDNGWGRGNRPVINVSYNDITQQFIHWLNSITKQHYRLPTEAEWEYVAKSGKQDNFSWGDYIGVNNANCRNCGSQWDFKQTAPIKSFKPNAFGVYDMHGNVWEWTEDCWNCNYNNAPTNGTAWKTGNCLKRVVKGSGWHAIAEGLRSNMRTKAFKNNRGDDGGFRLVLPNKTGSKTGSESN